MWIYPTLDDISIFMHYTYSKCNTHTALSHGYYNNNRHNLNIFQLFCISQSCNLVVYIQCCCVNIEIGVIRDTYVYFCVVELR